MDLHHLALGRLARSLVLSNGDFLNALSAAEGHRASWDVRTPSVARTLKAAVAAMTSTGGLAPEVALADVVLPALRGNAVIDKLTAARRVPGNVTLPGATSSPTGNLVLEGQVKPLSKMLFSLLHVGIKKTVADLVISVELAKLSSAQAEESLGAALVDASVAAMDRAFCSGTGSISDGASGLNSSGFDATSFRHDFKAMLQLVGGGTDSALASAVFVMPTRTALHVTSLTESGVSVFPDLTIAGGSIWGVPVLVTSSALSLSGSPTEHEILLISQAGIAIADEGATLSVAKSASIEMSDAPTGGATSLVSLWQLDLRCLRAERFAAWDRRADDDVVVLQQVQV